MAIKLFGIMAGCGKIRVVDDRASADDYDGTVHIPAYAVSNPVQLAGNGGYQRIRRYAQSGVGGLGETMTVALVRDGAEEATSVTRDFPTNGPCVIPLGGGATQLQLYLTLLGIVGTELGSADFFIVPRRSLRSGDGS